MYQNELNWYDGRLGILHQPELAEFTLKHYLFSAVSLKVRAQHNNFT